MKKMMQFTVGFVVSMLMMIGSAQALTLPVDDITFSLIDWSSIYRDPAGGGLKVPVPAGTIAAAGDEDRSIFRVDAINNSGGGAIPGYSPATEELTGILYDLYATRVIATRDVAMGPFGGSEFAMDFASSPLLSGQVGPRIPWVDLYGPVAPAGSGGHIDLYLDSPTDFSPAGGPGAWVESGGTDLFGGALPVGGDAYATVTDGLSWLACVFAPLDNGPDGIAGTADDTLMKISNFDLITGTGDGRAYLNIIGGIGAANFQTDTYGPGRDLAINYEIDFFTHGGGALPLLLPYGVDGLPFTADDYFFSELGPDGILGTADDGRINPMPRALNGWFNTSDDPVYGTTIPEPATMLLLGTGLLGLAGAARRKKSKIQ